MANTNESLIGKQVYFRWDDADDERVYEVILENQSGGSIVIEGAGGLNIQVFPEDVRFID